MMASEVHSLVISNNLTSGDALQAFIELQVGDLREKLLNFILGRVDAHVFVAQSWRQHTSVSRVRRANMTRLAILFECLSTQCVCNGQWIPMAKDTLERNGFDVCAFQNAIGVALRDGAGKRKNLLIWGPTNTGKTFLFLPLTKIFKCFCTPGSGGMYRMSSLMESDVLFLNDFRFRDNTMPWEALLLILEGSPFNLPMPQNATGGANKGDVVYDRKAPSFVTSIAPLTHPRMNMGEQDMMNARFTEFRFYAPIPVHQQKNVPPCARCFSEFIFSKPPDFKKQSAWRAIASGECMPALANVESVSASQASQDDGMPDLR
jgi:hypothetical protein